MTEKGVSSHFVAQMPCCWSANHTPLAQSSSWACNSLFLLPGSFLIYSDFETGSMLSATWGRAPTSAGSSSRLQATTWKLPIVHLPVHQPHASRVSACDCGVPRLCSWVPACSWWPLPDCLRAFALYFSVRDGDCLAGST